MDHPARGQGSWLPITQLITVLGLVVAVEHWGLPLMVALTCMTVLFAWGILGSMWGDRGLSAVPRILRRGLAVGLMGTAFVGLATTLGIISLLVAGVLAISHPQVWAKVRTIWTGLVTLPGERPQTENQHSLSDTALCAQWQSTHARLHEARTAREKAEIVQLRQECLDELHRRHPDGLAAWLASSGATPDANPQHYLTRGGRSESPDPGGP